MAVASVGAVFLTADAGVILSDQSDTHDSNARRLEERRLLEGVCAMVERAHARDLPRILRYVEERTLAHFGGQSLLELGQFLQTRCDGLPAQCETLVQLGHVLERMRTISQSLSRRNMTLLLDVVTQESSRQ